jgi:hypothetical protein
VGLQSTDNITGNPSRNEYSSQHTL